MASLDERLAQLLPPAPPPAEPEPEPMLAEDSVPVVASDSTAEFGDPSMDGMQVAGVGSILRGAIGRAEKKLGRGAVDDASRALDDAPVRQATDVKDSTAAIDGKPAAPPPPAVATPKPAKIRRAAKAASGTGKPPAEVFNYDLFDDQGLAKYTQSIAEQSGINVERITIDDVRKQVEALGIDADYLRTLDGQAIELKKLPVVVTRAAFAVPTQISRTVDVMERIAKNGETPELMQELLTEYALTVRTLQAAKNIQAAPAQALAVLNQGRPVIDMKQLNALAKDPAVSKELKIFVSALAQQTDNAAKVRLIEKTTKLGLAKDVWFSTYINGLLSSPVTHAKNITANTMFGFYQIPERLVASFYSNVLPDSVRGFKAVVPGAEKEKIALDEALIMAQSTRYAIGEAFQLAAKSFKTNKPILDASSKIEYEPRLEMGEALQQLFNADKSSFVGRGLDYYGTAVTLPGRALLAEDEFFKAVLYRQELNAQVLRRGKRIYRDAIDAKMSETDAIAKASSEIESLLKNPPDDLDELAMEYAKRGTFTSDLPPGLEKLQQGFNHPALKIFVPFFKTPANVGLQVLDRTPFALIPGYSRFYDEIAKGGVHRDMALAKVSLGSSLLYLFSEFAAEGYITGGGPKMGDTASSKKNEPQTAARLGAQKYSFKLGDSYYSFSGLEPIGAFAAIAGDLHEYALNEPDKNKVEQVFLGAVFGLYEYMKEMPYLQGLADLANVMGLNRQGGEIDGTKTMNELARQFGGFAIGGSPAGVYSSAVAAIERLSDPTKSATKAEPSLPVGIRGFYEAWNKYRSRLPYFSKDLPDSLNLWGDPIITAHPDPAMRGLSMVLPTRVSPEQFSPLDDALVRIGSPIGMPERKLQGIEMDDIQYNKLITIYSKELNAQTILMKVIDQPGFDLLSLKNKQDTVKAVHNEIMDAAKIKLLRDEPDLQLKIDELKRLRDINGLYYKPD